MIFIVAMLAVALWGATPIVTKIAVAELPADEVGLLRIVCAALVTAPVLLAIGLPRLAGPRQLGLLAFSVGGGFIAFPLLFSMGMARTSAAHAGLILAGIPLWTGLLGIAAERVVPVGTWWLGAAVALAGEAFLIGFDPDAASQGATLQGDLMVLLGGICASTGHVAGARLTPYLGTWRTALLGVTVGGVLLAPSAFTAGAFPALGSASPAAWAAIAFLAGGSTLLAFVAWYWALSHGGIARIGALQFSQPVLTLALAAAFLGERLTLPIGAASLVILGGVALTQRSGRAGSSRRAG